MHHSSFSHFSLYKSLHFSELNYHFDAITLNILTKPFKNSATIHVSQRMPDACFILCSSWSLMLSLCCHVSSQEGCSHKVHPELPVGLILGLKVDRALERAGEGE